tara:strand:+ start:61725 stop:62312 length:588 start_codon:yes stop_codon:yes gene_type:complete
MKIYKIASPTFYHGTDSPEFNEFDSSKATKGDQHYNPLGEAMYVTDKPDFANMFGKNVYEVDVPDDAKIKKINPSKAASAIGDILNRALKKVKIDYWSTDLNFKMVYQEQIKKAEYSPYEAIIDAVSAVTAYFPKVANEYEDWVSKIATQKFAKFDVVVFVGTNNPNDIFIGESPTQEILIFNKAFQKVFREYKK